jgi:hypothetical protein
MRDTVEAELNGVDDLVDHDLTKVEFLVLLLNILRDHSDALALRTMPSITVHVTILFFVFVQGTNTGSLANAAIAMGSRPVVLPPEIERLKEQEDRNLGKGEQK